MNDTTRWIMIILLLLLIAAAVFMLLRSPGKDKDDRGASLDRDGDRDGVAPLAEDRTAGTGSSARGVYDQEADARDAAPVETSAYDETTTASVEGRAAQADGPVHGTSTYDDAPAAAAPTTDPSTDPVLDPAAERPSDHAHDRTVGHGDHDDRRTTAYEDGRLPEDGSSGPDDAERYRPEAGATEDAVRPGAAGVTTAGAGLAGATAAAAATHEDREVERHDTDRHDTDRHDAERHDTDRHDTDRHDAERHDTGLGHGDDRGQDLDRGQHRDTATAGEVQPLTDDQITEGGRDEPLTRDEQEPFTGDLGTDRATDREAGPVDREDGWADGSHDADRLTDQPADHRDAGHEQQALPVDAGTGAPQTADEIVRDGSGYDEQPIADDRRYDDGAADQGQAAGVAPVFAESTYGAGSAEPLDDGSGPAGWAVKGNVGSMLFHTPESPSWDAVRAEVWFEDEEAARAAGFAHWDRRRR